MVESEGSLRRLFACELGKLGVPDAPAAAARIVDETLAIDGDLKDLLRKLDHRCGAFGGYTVGEALAARKLSIVDATKQTFPAETGPREQIGAMFFRLLSRTLDIQKAYDLAGKLENAVFDVTVQRCIQCDTKIIRSWESPQFVSMYSERARAIAIAINPDSSVGSMHGVGPLDDLLAGRASPEDIANKSACELTPAAIAAERAEIAEREKQGVKERTSKLYPCPNCRAKNCTYRSVQTRSLDEPATIYCKCMSCGFRYQG